MKKVIGYLMLLCVSAAYFGIAWLIGSVEMAIVGGILHGMALISLWVCVALALLIDD